jgi:hypothetical protein
VVEHVFVYGVVMTGQTTATASELAGCGDGAGWFAAWCRQPVEEVPPPDVAGDDLEHAACGDDLDDLDDLDDWVAPWLVPEQAALDRVLSPVPPAPGDPARLLESAAAGALIERIAQADRLVAMLQARQAADVAAFRALGQAEARASFGADAPNLRGRAVGYDEHGWATGALAVAVGWSEPAVHARYADADTLAAHPRVAGLVRAGRVSWWVGLRACQRLDELATVTTSRRLADLEDDLVGWLTAAPRTGPQVGRRLRRVLLRERARWEAAHPPVPMPDGPACPDTGGPSLAQALTDAEREDAQAAAGPHPPTDPDDDQPPHDLHQLGEPAGEPTGQQSGQQPAAGADDEPRGSTPPDPPPAPCPQGHARRQVGVLPLGDGTAEVVLRLPEADAALLWQTLRLLGRVVREEPDPRTADQRRADLAVRLLTGRLAQHGRPHDSHAVTAVHGPVGPPAEPGPKLRVTVDVTVPLSTLFGGPEPGRVTGWPEGGAVHADTARTLAGHPAAGGKARAVVYDDRPGRDGRVVAVGRLTWLDTLPTGPGYRPGARLADSVRARDVTCRFPGCTHTADLDLDHVLPYPAGPTSLTNLVALCRHHHRLKTHAPGWQTHLTPDGTLTWTTPTGHTATTTPHDHQPPD